MVKKKDKRTNGWRRLIRDYWWIVVLVVVIGRLVFIISRVDWQSPNYGELEQEYKHSQYNLGKGYEFWGNMVDEKLYTYAAMAYWRGVDPSQLNFEHPPFGKYWLGLSHRLTGSMMSGQIVAYLVLVGLVWKMGRRLKLSRGFNALVLAMVVFDPLVASYAEYVNLEIMISAEVLGVLYLVTSYHKTGRWYLWLGIVVGLVAATKMFVLGTILGVYVTLGLVVTKRKHLETSELMKMMGVAVGVYLASYWTTLTRQGWVYWIDLHIKIVHFYLGYLPNYPWFEIWRIIYLGRWRTWFANPPIQPVKEFWLVWPVGVSLAILTPLVGLKIKLPKEIWWIWGWVAVYLVFQSTHLVFPNYLIPILPLVYLISGWTVSTLTKWGIKSDFGRD